MTPTIDIRHLRYFLAVAEELSFTHAAERLRMAQPPLSQQIAQLERHVGTSLFVRRPRVSLTAAGQVFRGVAERTLTQLARGVDAAARTGHLASDRVVVGFASSVVFTTLPAAFRSFAKHHPGIELELKELHSSAQADALRAGIIDVALLRQRPLDRDIASEPAVSEPFVAVLAAGHPLASRARLAPRTLAAEPFILFPRAVAPTLHDEISTICRLGAFSPRVLHEALEWHTIVGLVAAGLGVTIAPAGVQRMRWRGVVYRPLYRTPVEASIMMAYRRSPAPQASVMALVAALRDVSGERAKR